MNKYYSEIARDIKKSLLKIVPLNDIRFFCPEKSGNDVETADIEFFLEVDHYNPETKTKISDLFWDAGLDYRIVFSYFLFTRKERENPSSEEMQVIKKFMEHGTEIS